MREGSDVGGTPRPRRSLGRPTMNDVAREARVSAKTVSRVVNGDSYVRPETAARIHAAIDRLGFRRNEAARLLRQGTAATVGLLFEDIADPFYATLTRAVEDAVFAHDHQLMIASSAEDPQRADRLISSFIARGVAGLIIAPANGTDERLLRFEQEHTCPIVVFDRPLRELEVDTVLVDNRGGARAGTRHLIEHGHRRIAYFGDQETVYTASERLAGYRQALDEAGIRFDRRLITMRTPSAEGAIGAIAALTESREPVTAVFSGNNRWSVHLLRVLLGKWIGLGFVGFDDFELADVVDPAMTVVTQEPAETGRIAAELLFRRIAGETFAAQLVQLPTRLIERGSGEIPGPFHA